MSNVEAVEKLIFWGKLRKKGADSPCFFTIYVLSQRSIRNQRASMQTHGLHSRLLLCITVMRQLLDVVHQAVPFSLRVRLLPAAQCEAIQLLVMPQIAEYRIRGQIRLILTPICLERENH